jgi:hypothetical protein
MSGVIPPLPQYAFMAWCSVKNTGTTLYLPLRGEGKSVFTKIPRHEGVLGCGCLAPSIFKLSTRRGGGSASRPRPPYSQGMNFQYPLDRRLGGSQNRSGPEIGLHSCILQNKMNMRIKLKLIRFNIILLHNLLFYYVNSKSNYILMLNRNPCRREIEREDVL